MIWDKKRTKWRYPTKEESLNYKRKESEERGEVYVSRKEAKKVRNLTYQTVKSFKVDKVCYAYVYLIAEYIGINTQQNFKDVFEELIYSFKSFLEDRIPNFSLAECNDFLTLIGDDNTDHSWIIHLDDLLTSKYLKYKTNYRAKYQKKKQKRRKEILNDVTKKIMENKTNESS